MIVLPEYERYDVVQALQVRSVNLNADTQKITLEFEDGYPSMMISATDATGVPRPGSFLVIDEAKRLSFIDKMEFLVMYKRISHDATMQFQSKRINEKSLHNS